MNQALVTCICPTTSRRREWIPKAIASFRGQAYENRKLLVVSEDAAAIADLIPANDPQIELVKVEAASRFGYVPTVGLKRNIGVQRATGDVICHWDDDDFYAPGRIADQVARLEESGKSLTGYHSVRFTDGEKWWAYSGHRANWAFDASFCYLKAFWSPRNDFADLNDGNEEPFRNAALRERKFISSDGTALMDCSIHPDNTSRRVIGAGWTEIQSPAA